MPIIEVKNLGKKYSIGEQESYLAIRDILGNIVRSPFNWMKKKVKGHSEEFWALRDINFSVEQGEVLGIIGRNGAGKSTLLKILSQITPPTTGEIRLKGRVGSLLEVGTGFHPELTGRENIYLNGSILGMRRKEITKKFDEIVEFSGIEKFLDTPVKRYSSGMYVRLAFAVAAHLEPDILIIDEVLAVGDTEFQKKCLGKMEEVTKKQRRTVLFVSHNMGAVRQLCQRILLLHEGKLTFEGVVDEGIKKYTEGAYSGNMLTNRAFTGPLSSSIQFQKIKINEQSSGVNINPSSEIHFIAEGICKEEILDFRITFSVYKDSMRIFSSHDLVDYKTLFSGKFEIGVTIPSFILRPGEYSIALGGHRKGGKEWVFGTHVANFTILEEWSKQNEFANFGIINIPHKGFRKQ